MNREALEAVDEWRRLVERREFFAAHEVLEAHWLRAAEPDRTFLKGLIHVAVALHHLASGNAHGARVKCRSALGYLEGYPDRYAGLDLPHLRAELEAVFSGVLAHTHRRIPPHEGPWPTLAPSDQP
jgi:predicted metal-dependent hydrolase